MTSLRIVAAVAFLTAVTAPTRADIVLDDFSQPTPTVVTNVPPQANPTTVVTDLGGGVTRSITYTVNALGSSPTLQGQVSAGGQLVVDIGFDAGATVAIQYSLGSMNFVPTGATGAITLTGQSQLSLGDNLPTTYTLSIATATGTLTGGGALSPTLTSSPISLASLSGTGDLTQVNGLTLTLNAGRAADFAIDSLGITTPDAPPPNVVPAPPAALLALAVLPVLALRRKRQAA